MIDLVFRTPAGGTDLVFGKSEPVAGEVYRVSVSGLFPPLVASMRVAVAYGLRVHAVLPDVTAHAVVSYRSEVSRPVVGNLQDDAGPGVAVAVARADRATPADRRQGGAKVAYGEAITLQSSAGVAWQDAAYRDSTLRAVFEDATGLGHSVRTAYQHAIATHQIIASAFEEARREARHLGANYQDALRHARLRIGGAYQEAGRQSSMLAAAGHVASPASHARRHRYQEAMSPRRGVRAAPVIPPRGCYTPPLGGAVHLLFGLRRSAGAEILFRCGIGSGTPAGALIIPTLRTYIVINDVTLVRLPDNTALQAYSMSLKWDIDSWSVGWTASLPASALDAVMPSGIGEPVELLATINDTPVRLLAESIARDRRFGDARLNVGGRGRVAWLAAPYAAAVARSAAGAMTSQQLAADALTDNGVPIGWSLDWQISDWIVPGGVWSHQGTMIDAVKRIAEAAGGYVLGHRTDQTLHVRPRYPLLPWEWGAATPDLILPAAVASTEAISWSESPAYNRVFVAGQEQGRTGQVTRAGTAGDILAPMVTDPLITHVDAARARGASILAAGGRQATVTLRLPVLPETGILDLGQLIEYQDGSTARRGLVRAVSVDAAIPTVWQTVEIETHA